MKKQSINVFLPVLTVFILTYILILLFPSSISREAGNVFQTPSSTSDFINIDVDSNPEETKPSPTQSEPISSSSSRTPAASSVTTAKTLSPAVSTQAASSKTHTIKPSPSKPTPVAVPSPSALNPVGIPDGIDNKKPVIALTFDDGPNVNVTNRILDTLEQYNAKATFFIVGNRLNSEKSRNTIARADSLGCEIGNHTYEHPHLVRLNADAILKQINQTNTLAGNITSKTPRLVRPPYGEYSDLVRANADAPLILWSIDTQDWLTRDAEAITNHILDNVKDGDIILMHDLYTPTADAAEMFVPQLIEKGYQLVTVSELFEIKNVQLKTRTVYSRLK